MQRVREILAHGGIATLAVVVALASAVFTLANTLGQQIVFALVQHIAAEDSGDLEVTVFSTKFDYVYVLQALATAMLVAGALLVVWRLTRPELRTCPECRSDVPRNATICRFCTSDLPAENS